MQFALCLLLILFVFDLPYRTGAADGLSDRIRDTKTLTIAYSGVSRPISYKKDGEDEGGDGYSVELCLRIAKGIERDLKLARGELEIEWLEGNAPERLNAVEHGKADLDCATTSITLDRQERVDFSNIVFVESGGIIALVENRVEFLSELAGKRLGVEFGTTTEKRLRELLCKRGIEADFVPVDNSKEGVEWLEAGWVDALAGDRLTLIEQAKSTGKPERFTMLMVEFSVDPYAFAMPRSEPDFRLLVNRHLARIYRSGEIYRIFAHHFGDEATPSDLLKTVFVLYGLQD